MTDLDKREIADEITWSIAAGLAYLWMFLSGNWFWAAMTIGVLGLLEVSRRIFANCPDSPPTLRDQRA